MKINKKIKKFFYWYILPYLGFFFVKLISMTYRHAIINPEIEKKIARKGKTPIYASWHQRFFTGLSFLSNRRPIAIMISQSRDGELASRIVKIFGWHPVRGSSSRSGKDAMHKLCNLTKKGYKIGHIVDGPNGPFSIIKPGLLKIAQNTGMPIIYTVVISERNWVFNKSWDKFIIPKPFSRVIYKLSPEIYIPKNLTKKEFDDKRLSMEKELRHYYTEGDKIWSRPDEVKKLFKKPALY